MTKIRFFFATSLDGYIADPAGGVGFLDEFDDGDEPDEEHDSYERMISAVDTLVMGRETYRFVSVTETGRTTRRRERSCSPIVPSSAPCATSKRAWSKTFTRSQANCGLSGALVRVAQADHERVCHGFNVAFQKFNM